MAEPWQIAGFGLYVHWPFCQAKCPYCDFNSHVVGAIDQDAWRQALVAEVARHGDLLGPRPLRSIYFGGGTPSLMPRETVAAVIDAAARHFSFANDIEITLEANPGSVERGRFAGYRRAGVNRVSLGVQALSDPDLKALGRLHDRKDALAALSVALETFDRVSFDLIYARQHQSLADWQEELTRALAFGPDHLSLYQLTIEDGTAFAARQRAGGLRGLPDEDLAADMFDLTQTLTAEAGLPAYEISNHARPGQESRHNLIYWRGGDWAGIGPGAHGRLTMDGQRWATETALAPAAWLRAAQAGDGTLSRHALPEKEAQSELLMMGLRTVEGLPLDRISALRDDVFNNKINYLERDGFLKTDTEYLRVTAKGRPVLNAILREVLPDPEA